MLIKNYLLLTILTIFILLINEEKVFALNTSVSAGAGGGGGYSLNIGSGSGGGGGYDLNIGSGSGGGGGYDLNIGSGSGGGGGYGLNIGAGAGGGGNGVDDYFDDYESNNDIYSFYPNNHSNSASGEYNSDNDYDSGAFDSIEDYYDYLENIGVDISNVGNITDNELINYYVVDNATALKSDNSQYVGKLVSNGFNTKFIITNINGTKYYLKKWFKLLTATGQQGWYHFDNDGNMNTGFYNDTDGNTYYFMENGINKGMMVTGQMIINGIFYNFSYGNDGRPQGALIR